MHTNNFDEILEITVGQSDYPPDKSQREVIKSINNTVVAAGAGSGKTEVLATRFAYLLMTDPDLHVGNILAITFTKKAASEIYERVFKKLRDFAESLSNPKYNEKYTGENKPVYLAKRALEEFSDAKIQTLDSYSNDIVRLSVARYGIKPDFTIGAEDTDTKNFAKNFVLENLKNQDYSEAFKNYTKAGKIEEFTKNYICDPVLSYTSIATPDGWFCKNFETQTEKIIEAWNDLFNEENENCINPKKICKEIIPLYEENKDKTYKNLGIPYSETDYFRGIENFINKGINIPVEDFKIQKNDKNSMDKICSQGNRIIDWIKTLPSGSATGFSLLRPKVKEATGNYFEAIKEIIQSIVDFAKYNEASKQMFTLMDLFLQQINSRKKKNGTLSFKDVQELALKTLREQKDILKQQQSQIKKIMIDEFQDNNQKNKELLDLIAGDSTEKLFFVGDEKQSIYKFRGADVSVFNDLKNNLKGHNEEKVLHEMNNNYRSDKELLKAFNELFGDDNRGICNDTTTSPSLFHFENYPNVPDYEATYLKKNYATKPGKDGKDCVEDTKINKDIRIHACILHKGENKNKEKFSDFKSEFKILDEHETEAYYIAKKIKELGKPYSKYAILDKSRTHRNKIQKYLTMLGIPFSVDVQKNIFEEGIVNDFYNLLRICVYPNDRNAFFSFLMSPFVNLSSNAAQNIMAEFSEDNFEVFSDELDLSKIKLTEEDSLKYEKAKSFYEKERYSLLSSSITKSIEQLWYDTGYFYETQLNENTKIYGEQFDLLYQVAVDAENQGKNIAWFIDQLSIIKSTEISNSKLNEDEAELETDDVHYPLEKNDAVTIMTIHQSKGLEFDTVFILGAFSSIKTDSLGSVYFEENEEESESSGVSLSSPNKTNYFYIKNKELSKNKALAEEKRLIYVAITRAKKEVYILGSLSESDNLKKKSEDAACPVMHKILRYYYLSDKGLYQDNDYSDEALNSGKVAEEAYYNETANAPFDFIKLNPVSAKVKNLTKNSSTDQKQKLANKMEKIFFNKGINNQPIELPAAKEEKVSSPSALEKLQHNSIDNKSQLAEKIDSARNLKQNDMYNELNSFFEKEDYDDSEELPEENAASQNFNRAAFGTMVHAYLENWAKTGTILNPEFSSLNIQLSKCLDENFSKERKDILYKICRLMTENFAEGNLGKLAKEAKDSGRIFKAENNFKMMLGDILFTGSVDLFFEKADGTVVLVDYKTDEKISAEKYFEQQYCYKESIEKIYGKKVSECWLYYLRYDCGLEITDEVKKFSEKILSKKFDKGFITEETFGQHH